MSFRNLKSHQRSWPQRRTFHNQMGNDIGYINITARKMIKGTLRTETSLRCHRLAEGKHSGATSRSKRAPGNQIKRELGWALGAGTEGSFLMQGLCSERRIHKYQSMGHQLLPLKWSSVAAECKLSY